MMKPSRALAAGALALLCAAAPAARADGSGSAGDRESAASEIFRAGAAAYARREFRAAAVSFEAAFREAPHGGAMYNAGLAWEAAGEPARAADDYQAALAAPGLDGAQAKDAEARLARLSVKLARVDISAPAGATVWLEQAEGVLQPARIHVMPGEHAVRVVLPGGAVKIVKVKPQAGEVVRVAIAAPPPPPPPRPLPPPAPSPPAEAAPGTQRVLGWIAVGTGGALAGAAIALGVATLDARDDFEASGRTDPDVRDRTLALRAWTNAAWIGGAVLGGVGLALVLTAPEPKAPRGAGLYLGPTGGGLYGRF